MTKILKISPDNPEEDEILSVAEFLREGRVLIYPTDTVYGLGCSIDSSNVERVFDIKKRDKTMPLSVAFSSIEMVDEYAVVGAGEREFIIDNIDKPYTFILKKKERIPDIVTAGKDSVGVRIPNHAALRRIVEAAGVPIITTSANASGEAPPTSVEEISDEIKDAADLVIDSGPCRVGKPSKVIDLCSGKVLRE